MNKRQRMTGRIRCLLLFFLIPWMNGISPTFAQQPASPSRWYGTLGLTGGLGSIRVRGEEDPTPIDTLFHQRGEASFLLGYRTPTFSIANQLKGQWVGKETIFNHSSVNNQDMVGILSRETKLRQPSGSWRTDVQWKPSDRNQYSTFLVYQVERDKTVGMTFNMLFQIEDTEDMEDEAMEMKLATEERRYLKQTLQAGWRSTHLWPERHLTLNTFLDGTTRFHRRHSLWEQMTGENDVTFLLTPQSSFHEGRAAAYLRKDRFLSVPSLQFEGALQVRSTYTEDTNGGQIEIAPGIWRDSTGLKEHYNHLALWIEPGINADYRTGAWHFRVEGALQLYGEQLTNERHFRDIAWDRPAPVGRLFTEWTPSNTHRVFLNATHTIKQPTYLQRCWFDRQDANADQLFRGNPNLEATRIDEVTLNYTFRWKRFQATSMSRLTYRDNEAEQSLMQDIIARREYKVFTWVNTAFKRIFTQALTVSWSGQVFSANGRVQYDKTRQRAASLERELRTHHWELSGEAAVKPGKGWAFSTRAAYKGDVETLYSLLEGYCTLDARIEKSFKQVTVFLEGRDLLDEPMKREFTSADGTDVWAEVDYMNRKLFLAGFTWSF